MRNSTAWRPGRIACTALLILMSMSGCGGGGNNKSPDPAAGPQPSKDLVWDEGTWNELDWQ